MDQYLLRRIAQYGDRESIPNLLRGVPSFRYGAQQGLNEFATQLQARFPGMTLTEAIRALIREGDTNTLMDIRDFIIPLPNPINWYMFADDVGTANASYAAQVMNILGTSLCTPQYGNTVKDVRIPPRPSAADIVRIQRDGIINAFNTQDFPLLRFYLNLLSPNSSTRPSIANAIFLLLNRPLSIIQMNMLWQLADKGYILLTDLMNIKNDKVDPNRPLTKDWQFDSILHYDAINHWRQYRNDIMRSMGEDVSSLFYLPNNSKILSDIVMDEELSRSILRILEAVLRFSDDECYRGRVERLLYNMRDAALNVAPNLVTSIEDIARRNSLNNILYY